MDDNNSFRREELKRRTDQILDALGEGVYGLDLEGKATFANPAAAKMTGWEIDELIGKPQHEIIHHSRADGSPYPDGACPIYAAFRNAATYHVADEVFWRRSGASFPVEYCSTPMRDEHGEVVGAVVVFRDITERKRAENKLRFANFALDRVGPAAFWMDADGKFFYVNEAACRLVNYTREELLSMHVADLNPDYPAEAWPDTWKTIKERGSYTFEARFRSKDGKNFPADITVNYLKSDGGEYNCSFVRDITERKEAEEERQRACEELEGKVERRMLRKNPYELTFRELTVLHHVAAGKADKEIAYELGISPLTVQNHVSHILRQMNASSRTAAGVRAVRDGLVD